MNSDTIPLALIAGIFAFITGLCMSAMFYQAHYLFAVVGCVSFVATVLFTVGAVTAHKISAKDEDDESFGE